MKRRKKRLLITLPILLVIIGAMYWKSILLWMGGFHMPELETKESVRSYIESRSAVYHALVIPDDSLDANYLHKNFHTPGIIFFDTSLRPIKSSSGEGCPKSAAAFIKELNRSKQYEADYSKIEVKDLDDVLNKVVWVNGDEAKLNAMIREKDFDYIAVYSWIKFLPDQSDLMMKIGEHARENHNAKILVVSLNLDFVKEWYGDRPIDIEID